MESVCLQVPAIDVDATADIRVDILADAEPFPQAGSLPAFLPESRFVPTRMSVFMFSAITWNRHHIHYDRDAARAEGLVDVAVQRALIGNYFARSLAAAFGGRACLRRLAWRMHKSAYPGHALCCRGVVVGRTAAEHGEGPQGEALQCELEMLDDNGDTVSTATAFVCTTDIS